MNNILLTGEVQVGKSTVIQKVLDMLKKDYDLKIGGYRGTRALIKEENKTILRFGMNSLSDNSSYKVLQNEIIDGKNNVTIYSESFDEYAPKLKADLENCNLIILDEIGFAESNSPKYLEVLNEALDSDKVVFGVLKKWDCPVVNGVRDRQDVTLFNIDEDNRDYIYNEIYLTLLDLFM